MILAKHNGYCADLPQSMSLITADRFRWPMCTRSLLVDVSTFHRVGYKTEKCHAVVVHLGQPLLIEELFGTEKALQFSVQRTDE